MKLIFVAIFLLVIAYAAVAIKKRQQSEAYSYRTKKLLSNPEQILFYRLREALPEHIILAQTQMSRFLTVADSGKGRQSALNKILMKSADFLVCKKDFSVIAVIELQDETHRRSNRQKSDEFKRAALGSASLPLIEYNVKNMPSVEEIRENPKFEKPALPQT